MTVKKQYNIGDIVWIYGITNGRSTKGTVIQTFTVDQDNWDPNRVHYVISVPTEIEPLLEVRTWETISETKDGHVGSMRDAFSDPDASIKMIRRTGLAVTSDGNFDYSEEDDISPDEIHAALDASQLPRNDVIFKPVTKENNTPRKRYPPRKKKRDTNQS